MGAVVPLDDLASPHRSFRLMALEECIRAGDSEKVLAALHARQGQEDDPECTLLLGHAIQAVQERLSRKDGPSVPGSEAEIETCWLASDAAGRLLLLHRLPPALRNSLAARGTRWLEGEAHSLVRAALIRTFGAAWPEAALPGLVRYLGEEHLSTRLAALELLTARSPQLMIDCLPPLLRSPEPRLRVLAIQGLARIDVEEAARHLEHLWQSGDAGTKRAAIQCGFQLPFAVLKPYLLNFCALETQPDLVDEAGVFFAINPDPEVPYRLWEIAESSPPAKRDVLKVHLQAACQAIRTAGLITEEFPEFLRKLQEWIYQRGARRLVQDHLRQFHDPGAEQDSLLRQVEASLAQPRIRQAWQEALALPLPEGLRNLLQSKLAVGTPPPTPVPGGASAPIPPGPVPAADREASSASGPGPLSLDLLGFWEVEDRQVAEPRIRELLTQTDLSDQVLGTTLRAALRLEIPGFVVQAEAAQKRTEPQVRAAGIEYLGRFDPDRLFPFLGRYVQDPSPRVRGAALRILKRFDPQQAVSSLRAMLTSRSLEFQDAALGTMVHFDFSLVRSLLVEFLRQQKDQTRLENALCLFQANPEGDNLYLLFALERELTGKAASLAAVIRRENEAFLEASGQLAPGPAGAREREFLARWEAEQARKKKPRPAYALERVAPATDPSSRSSWAGFLLECLGIAPSDAPLRERWAAFWLAWRVPMVVGMVALLFLGEIWNRWETAVEKAEERTAKPGVVLALPMDLQGTIRSLSYTGCLVESAEARMFVVDLPPGQAESLQVGQSFAAQVIPIRISTGGYVMTRLVKLVKE